MGHPALLLLLDDGDAAVLGAGESLVAKLHALEARVAALERGGP